ncbi:hypothetical protein BaRGS_00038492 [Batillaria attramentaria]|uniref:ABC transporter domain-containing protein n=1 Tax=Batillaria attramentaria TaxID=370345 RepID=A0ABD0J5W7_9CAEN
MLMLLLDTALHLIITWYLDAVLPSEYGVPEPFYFFLTTFPGVKDAVDNLTLNMYEGQITALLGHNGAGKTTTMFLLTGFYPPTSGSAVINGYDIRTELGAARESLGLCPQHDVLFDTLTVQQHLLLFAKFKGSLQAHQETETMLKDVGLETKRHAIARTLSGGQKRKLSVAIALIGGSKVLILDEPTSGMDPSARRQIWDLMQRHRTGRTIMLSTHFMDEADALADRIAIMANGKLMCCGTPMFLKKLYGTGYHLIIVKATGCKVSKVTRVIKKGVPGATFQKATRAELFYLMPDTQSSRFAALFRELEARKEELGILSFGGSDTTMEDVFLRFIYITRSVIRTENSAEVRKPLIE